MLLCEAFEAVRSHPLMVNIPHEIGDLALLAAKALPCFIWVPTNDTNRGPIQAHNAGIYQGKQVVERARATREAGCDVHLFSKGDGLEGIRQIEQLYNDWYIALYHSLNGCSNFGWPTGRWDGRKNESEASMCYVISFTVYVQVYELNPMGPAQFLNLTPQLKP